jgi:hypothetical protein
MFVPTAVVQQAEIDAQVEAVEKALAPDVVRIRYGIGEDWSGQWAIFFRIVLSDEAARYRLRDVANNLERKLAEHLNFPALGVFPYHNFRSSSEQAELREEAWA